MQPTSHADAPQDPQSAAAAAPPPATRRGGTLSRQTDDERQAQDEFFATEVQAAQEASIESGAYDLDGRRIHG